MKNVLKWYFVSLGICALILGFLSVVSGIGGEGFIFGFLEMPSDIFRGVIGGFILLFSGIFYIDGTRKMEDIHQLAKVVMGSILIWILAGCEIFSMICSSIPGETGWLNSPQGFLVSYMPPYAPSVVLLPFSIIVLYVIKERG
ncbi:MAG TPA: hypothetical protein ENG74_01200 [Thermoplasmatales archaeon]|nr:hypothetical protein [Thermoplasmatales archaeon]